MSATSSAVQQRVGARARPPCARRRRAAAAAPRSRGTTAPGTSWPNWKTKPNSERRSALALDVGHRRQLAAVVERPSRSPARTIPAMQCSSVDLPEPDGPMIADDLAGGDRELRARQRGGRAVGLAAARGRSQAARSCRHLRSASWSSRAAVSSSQRRSASRWNSAWSQISWSAMSPSRLRAVSSRISRRCSARCASSSVVRAAPGQQREHDLRVQRALQVRLGLLGLAQPALDVGHAGRRDRVALALRPGAGLDAVDLDQPVLQQPRERRVDLAVGQRAVRPEALVVGPLEVVAVSRAALEQPQEGRSDRHAHHYTHRVYALRIHACRLVFSAAYGPSLRPQERRDHRARRSRQDHARRRDAVAVRRLPREPGRQ